MIRSCLAIEPNRMDSRTEKCCEKKTRRRVTISSRDDILYGRAFGSLHSWLRVPLNLVSCYLPRRTRRYILTIRSLRIYFPRCFPLHLYLFRRVFRCTSRLLSSTPLRLKQELAVDRSLIQFLEFANAPDRPSHSRCSIPRDAPREFLAINSSAAIYMHLRISRHGVKL